MVGLPPPQELGGEDLAEKRPGVPDDTHLDVPLLQQLVPHAVAVEQGSPARRGTHFIPLGSGHLAQQRLALLRLPAVAAPAGAAGAIHGSPAGRGWRSAAAARGDRSLRGVRGRAG